MEEKFEELKTVYHNWNRKWKHEQIERHEQWEMRRSYLDRQTISFEENLYKRVQWEKEKKHREWRKYRLMIEKKVLGNMSKKEIISLRKYIIHMNRVKRETLYHV
jgi:hypothetical protein